MFSLTALLADGDIDAANIVPGATRGLHRVLVGLEQLVECLPCLDVREVLPRSRNPTRSSLDAEGGILG